MTTAVTVWGRMRQLRVGVVFALGGVACASSSGGGGEVQTALVADAGSSPSTCAADALPASAKVMAAIDANAACVTNADCTTIELSTSCFDSCTRAVATSGRDAVEAAKTSASANECQAFVNAGCKLEAPACAPSSTPACVAGKCS